MSNILVLSAGRRVELVQLFRRALRMRLPDAKVIAADAQSLAPALYFADERVRIPLVRDTNYLDDLCGVILENEVDLVIPTIDPELPILSRNREYIRERTGAHVMVADPWVVDIARDKLLTHFHLTGNGMLTPEVFDDLAVLSDDDFPVVVKPRNGSASIGVHVASTPEELSFYVERSEAPIIQKLVTGDEYSVDCFSDMAGNPVTIVPRLRMATRGGEIAKGRVVRDRWIIDAVKSLLSSLPMRGPSTVQCFKTERGIEFIEVNPRFGGGAPMSIRAGADSCSNLLRMLEGETLEYNEDYEEGLTFLRYDYTIMLEAM